MKLKNLLGASIMTMSLMLSVTPQPVLADDESTDVFVTSVETAAATLTEEQYKIYAVAKQQMAEIAAGKRDYSVVEVNVLDTFGQETLDTYNYTLSQLGLSESNFDSDGLGDVAADIAFQNKWEADAGFSYYTNSGYKRINHAIFLSLGYEVYWYDRAAQGIAAWPARVVLKTLEDGSKVVGMDERSYIPVAFGVSEKYRGSGDKETFLEKYYKVNGWAVPNYTVNTALTSSTSEHVLRVARQVVADNAGKTDLEKLYAYKDWICEHVAYDDAQSQYVGTDTDMGDSSQATNVFDEDESTNVVCEGYAKAFKLLCDLSDFQDETLICNIVMGPASGSAGGSSYGEDHMWNVVTINGKNYIADVTNTDEGSVGEAGVYFLVGGNRISSWSGFGYSMSGKYLSGTGGESGTMSSVNHSMTYKYDDDTQDAYTEAALTIDKNSPVSFETLEEAGRYVAEQMKVRNNMIVVSCAGASSSVDLRTALLDEAFKHTGEAGYGDNLKRQIDSYYPATSNNTVIYDCRYFDTAAQVAQFEADAETVLADMNLDGMTDYQKIETIYKWICQKISYEHDEDTALAPKHTASGALRDRSAVCEGYANLTYYFLLKAGIDNRIVVSKDHSWNIVKLGNWYYNIDTTWDATKYTWSWNPKYFLKTDDDYRKTDVSIGEQYHMDDYYTHHVRLAGDDCTTQEFYDAYPMARYSYGDEPEMTEANITVTFNDEDNPAARPDSVTVTLNDGQYDYKVNVTAENNWTAAVSVPKNEEYTASASAADGYTATIAGDLTNGFAAEYVLNHYTVTWTNYDGSILETDENVAYGLTPEYNGETPVREASDLYNYTFKGWTPQIKAVTADATYRADFDQVYRTSIDYVDSITLSETSFVYDGTEKKPEVTVKDSGNVLEEGVDYTVAYENNINAGTASVILTGINNYRSTSTRTFTIEKAEQSLTVTPAEVTLKVGDTAELTVEADDEVTYTSADEAVATVENGTITAVAAGETIVTVTVAEKDNYKAATAEVKVTVYKDMANINSYIISLDADSYVYDGTEKKPAVTVSDGETILTEGTDYTVAYENNTNAGTASVVVTGIGTYTGTVTKAFTIEKAEQSLTVTPTEVTLEVGETADLTVEAEGTVTYASADEKVATVAEGKITAVGGGETTITVTLAETENYKAAEAVCRVTVTNPVVTAASITVTPEKLALVTGKVSTLKAEVLPENTTDKTVTWSTSDDAIATVNKTTGVVKAVSVGTATITAATSNGLTATCEVTVTEQDDEDVFVTSVETAAATLTEEQYKIYAVAKQQMAEIAAGKRDYSVVEVNVLDTFGQETLDTYNYTLSQLGLSESNFDSDGLGDVAADIAFQNKWEADAGFSYYTNSGYKRINHAIFLSLGYEVYWYDRAAQGIAAWPARVVLKTLEDGSKVVGMDERSYIPVAFGVSEKYRGSGDKETFLEKYYKVNGWAVPNYTVNTALTSSTSEHVLRVARQVVADNAGKTDLEKLYAYKDWICEHVAYDDAQSQYVGTDTDMGDSSQATNVFDEDESTNVVCEGYAKAFKLLCDLSDFQDETLICNIVMGPASGSAGGSSYGEDHMWNVVTINGKNYIADVTNTDEGSVGEAGVYFLVGGNRISSWSGFGYSMSGKYLSGTGGESGTMSSVNHSMTYKYDDDTQDAYTEAALTIDKNSPVSFETLEEAGRYVAEQMKVRNNMIVVSCAGASSSVDLRTALLDEAFKHTGEAGYGDNLKRQIDSYYPATSNNTVIYDCRYFDTAAQVAQFEADAETVLADMNLDGMTDYQKIETIYKWICQKISYEHDEDTALAPKHTASGALRDRSAVCEGYANLTYYFLLKAGIDNRIVVSKDHSWNIVKLGNWYYNIDTTWDATKYTWSWNPKYFLKTDDDYRKTDVSIGEQYHMDDYYTHHVRLAGDDCTTQEFYDAYPMARYSYGDEPEMTEANITVTFNDEDNPAARPDSVTVTLNDGQYDYKVNVTAENNWTAAVSVPKNEEYTASASAADGYTATIAGDLTNGFAAEYVLNHYTVTWTNYDGSILETDENVAYGLTPEYNGETPVREASDLYNYTFKGWTPQIKAVTADATYRADFDQVYRTSIDYVDSITLSETSFVYDGTEKKPEVTVKDSGNVLEEGVDYTVAYENNINAGTASVILTGINNYRSTSTRTFTIEKAEQSLTVTPAEVTLKVGDTAELTVEADDEVTYTSADEAIATVENGTITAVAAGETTITVTLAETENYKAATAEVKVTVEVIPPTELEVLADDIANSEDPVDVVTFDTETEQIEVIKEKIEEAKNSGETITVELESDVLEEVSETEIDLIVETVNPDENTKIEYYDINLLLKAGDNDEPIAKIVETKELITVTLPLSEEAKETGGEYRVIRIHEGAVKEIPCTVSEDGNYIIFKTDKFSTYAVVIVPQIMEESVSVSPSELIMSLNETSKLTATVEPEGADQTVTWTSSDETVAAVSADGVVTAISAGTATITAATVNGLTAECVVTVEDDYVIRNIKFQHSCSFGNDLSINYYAPADALAGYENIRMEVRKEVFGKDGGVSWETSELKNYTEADLENGKNYRFVYSGITAKEMGSEVRMVLKAEKNGKTYTTEEDVYGIGIYAYSRLEKSTDDLFKTLLVDMLNYGAEAQEYFKYNTGKLVNAELTDEQKALGTQEDVELKSVENIIETEGAAATFYGKSAVFNANVELKYYMQFAEGQSLDNVKLVLTYTAIDGKEYTEEIKAADFGFDKKYQAYTAKLVSIAAKDVRCTVSAKIYDGETLISNTLEYSLETYAYNRLIKSTDEVFKSFLREFMKYGFSAEAYFKKQNSL